MFMFEAEILGRLEHPGVIPVYERGSDPEGKDAFYAMKLVRGETLEAYVNEWTLWIEDITPFVAEQRTLLRTRGNDALVTPLERAYPGMCPRP